MRDFNIRVQGLKRKQLFIREYTAQFHLLVFCIVLIENEQAYNGRCMNGVHTNIQQILKLHHLTHVEYSFQAPLKADTVAQKHNSSLPWVALTASFVTRAPLKVNNGKACLTKEECVDC